MEMRDKNLKTDKPELPRQFYPHCRHQERLLSSYPFLRYMVRDSETLLTENLPQKGQREQNADKSKLEASESDMKNLKGLDRIKEVVVRVVEVCGYKFTKERHGRKYSD